MKTHAWASVIVTILKSESPTHLHSLGRLLIRNHSKSTYTFYLICYSARLTKHDKIENCLHSLVHKTSNNATISSANSICPCLGFDTECFFLPPA